MKEAFRIIVGVINLFLFWGIRIKGNVYSVWGGINTSGCVYSIIGIVQWADEEACAVFGLLQIGNDVCSGASIVQLARGDCVSILLGLFQLSGDNCFVVLFSFMQLSKKNADSMVFSIIQIVGGDATTAFNLIQLAGNNANTFFTIYQWAKVEAKSKISIV